jgi:protein-L-isoaspartate(D-aspartate) O-methyltransferase
MPADQLTTDLPRTDLEVDGRWWQTNIEFHDWTAAADTVSGHLRPVLDRLPARWWYIRKHPHWRIRHQPHNQAELNAPLPALLDALTADAVVRTWHPAIYEPEAVAFGGPAGMRVAHELFCRDSPTTLHLLTAAPAPEPAAGRVELSLLAISRMLRAAGLDWYEQGDVWAKVAASRPHSAINSPTRTPTRIPTPTTGRPVAAAAPSAARRLLTLDTGPNTDLTTHGPLARHRSWLDAFDDTGTRLATLAATGQLARGLRAVLAHHVIFHWNRLAIPGDDQHTLAVLSRDALLPPDTATR